MAPKRFRIIPLILLLGWMVVVTVLSLLPAKELPLARALWDKLEHASAYAVMTALAGWSWGDRRRPLSVWSTAALGGALYGGAIELAQGAVGTGRSADPGDALANAVGAGAVWLVAVLCALGKGRGGTDGTPGHV